MGQGSFAYASNGNRFSAASALQAQPFAAAATFVWTCLCGQVAKRQAEEGTGV